MGGIVDSVAGELFGTDDAQKANQRATDAQLQGIRESNQLQRDLFNAQSGLTEFQRGIGNQALAQLGGLYGLQGGYNPGGSVSFADDGSLNINPGGPAPVNQGVADYSAFFNSPDYQFALQQGQQGLDRQQAARGNLFSGGAAREASRFNQGLASQQFGNYANRLSNLAGIGTQGTNSLANALQTTGTNIGQGLQNMGATRASGYQNQAAIDQNALSNFWNLAIGGAQAAAGAAGGVPTGGGGGGVSSPSIYSPENFYLEF